MKYCYTRANEQTLGLKANETTTTDTGYRTRRSRRFVLDRTGTGKNGQHGDTRQARYSYPELSAWTLECDIDRSIESTRACLDYKWPST